MTIAEKPGGLKIVKLADGKRTVVPEALVLLNPGRKGRHLYFAWAFTEDGPSDFDSAARGRGEAPLFGYLTDHADLYVAGRHDVPCPRERLAAVKSDYLDMLSRVARHMEGTVGEGAVWFCSFCLCDPLGGEVPVGTSFGMRSA